MLFVNMFGMSDRLLRDINDVSIELFVEFARLVSYVNDVRRVRCFGLVIRSLRRRVTYIVRITIESFDIQLVNNQQ
jgi:hypothetical protein